MLITMPRVCAASLVGCLLSGGGPPRVSMHHPHGQLQYLGMCAPAGGWVPNLFLSSPPLSVPPGYPGIGLQGLPPVTSLGVSQAALGHQLPCSLSCPGLALLPSEGVKQALPMKPPLQAGGVPGAPKVPGTFPSSSTGWATGFVSLPSGGLLPPGSQVSGPTDNGVPLLE